ncbi:MAG TPA: hypothetical protein VGZ22_02160 [Isosphaeraceae bacterium]|nr:hypothetical protein [Isosphaeraceae bacterium]
MSLACLQARLSVAVRDPHRQVQTLRLFGLRTVGLAVVVAVSLQERQHQLIDRAGRLVVDVESALGNPLGQALAVCGLTPGCAEQYGGI